MHAYKTTFDCPVMHNKQEINDLFDKWNQALKTCDPDRVVALYAFNAVLLPTLSNKVRRSHAEMKDYFIQLLANKPSCKINESSIRFYGDIAIHSGIYTFTLFPPAKGSSTVVPARFTFVYQWSGDQWLIVEHHSSLMPEAD